MNPAIVELQMRALCNSGGKNYCLFAETLQRNRVALNRPVDSVVLRTKQRVYAEAFELLGGPQCFGAHLLKTLGQTEREAVLAIASVENFLLDSYLVITGIVQRSLLRHPLGGNTQCHKLNAECWRAIVRHPRTADVLISD